MFTTKATDMEMAVMEVMAVTKSRSNITEVVVMVNIDVFTTTSARRGFDHR
jgi:hypothetical protein